MIFNCCTRCSRVHLALLPLSNWVVVAAIGKYKKWVAHLPMFWPRSFPIPRVYSMHVVTWLTTILTLYQQFWMLPRPQRLRRVQQLKRAECAETIGLWVVCKWVFYEVRVVPRAKSKPLEDLIRRCICSCHLLVLNEGNSWKTNKNLFCKFGKEMRSTFLESTLSSSRDKKYEGFFFY